MDFTKKNGVLVSKQRLFAPMLATFGGGSARGFNPGGGAEDGNYFGSEYQNWTGADLIFDSSTSDTFTTGPTYQSLDTFIDNAGGKIYGGYDAVSYNAWSNGSSTYSGNANFYSVDPSTDRTTLSGAGTSGIASSGRGCTVAYMRDASRTAVLVVGHTAATPGDGAYFYKIESTGFGSYLGNMDFTDSSGAENNSDDVNLVYDGQYLLRMNRNQSIVYGYEMPSSISGSLNLVYQWSAPAQAHYSMVFCGYNASGQRRIIASIAGGDSGGTEILLEAPTALNQYSLGYTQVGSAAKFDSYNSTSNYSLALDYKNSNLIVGGYGNGTYRVYST